MSHLSIHLVPKNLPESSPLWETYAWKTRAPRLEGLKLDPNSFISQYESEAKQPIEFTIERLKEPNAWTFVLIRSPDEATSQAPDVLLLDSTEYIGFCVIVDIRSVPTSMTEREGTNHQDQGADWFLAAVYVDRSVRGTGFGKKMVQFGIETIRDASRKSGTNNAVCSVTVMHGNDNARETLQEAGVQGDGRGSCGGKGREILPHHTTQNGTLN